MVQRNPELCLSEHCDYRLGLSRLVSMVLRTEPELVCARKTLLSSTPGRSDACSIDFSPLYFLPYPSSDHWKTERFVPTSSIVCKMVLGLRHTVDIIHGSNVTYITRSLIYFILRQNIRNPYLSKNIFNMKAMYFLPHFYSLLSSVTHLAKNRDLRKLSHMVEFGPQNGTLSLSRVIHLCPGGM